MPCSRSTSRSRSCSCPRSAASPEADCRGEGSSQGPGEAQPAGLTGTHPSYRSSGNSRGASCQHHHGRQQDGQRLPPGAHRSSSSTAAVCGSSPRCRSSSSSCCSSWRPGWPRAQARSRLVPPSRLVLGTSRQQPASHPQLPPAASSAASGQPAGQLQEQQHRQHRQQLGLAAAGQRRGRGAVRHLPGQVARHAAGPRRRGPHVRVQRVQRGAGAGRALPDLQAAHRGDSAGGGVTAGVCAIAAVGMPTASWLTSVFRIRRIQAHQAVGQVGGLMQLPSRASLKRRPQAWQRRRSRHGSSGGGGGGGGEPLLWRRRPRRRPSSQGRQGRAALGVPTWAP